MTPPITEFRGPYGFLSNFASAIVYLDGEVYPTTEHAFQAAKTFDPVWRKMIREAPTPGGAKRLGRQVVLRPDWEEVKLVIMHDLLVQKFSHSDLMRRLQETGDAKIIEGNSWGDRTWGCVLTGGRWVGENYLGKLLMLIRDGR
jgi:ribA/ribD-fused uncharacterized protein